MASVNDDDNQSENIISMRIKQPDAVHSIQNGERTVTIDGLSTLRENLVMGCIIFITLGGDKGKGCVDWDLGFYGLAHVSREPYDAGYETGGRGQEYFKIDIDIDCLLSHPIPKEGFIQYLDAYRAPYIGPELRRSVTQAICTMNDKNAVAVIRAVLDMMPEMKENFDQYFSKEFMDKVYGNVTKFIEMPVPYGVDNHEAARMYLKEYDAVYQTSRKRKNGPEEFRAWLHTQRYVENQKKYPYSESTIDGYVHAVASLEYDGKTVDGYEITDIAELRKIADAQEKGHRRPAVQLYITFLKRLSYPLNWILFGAPGTGKSYDLKRAQEVYFPDAASFERVTFHPAYSYAQFFGTYKPVSEGKELYYQFVPGPFVTMLLRALQHPDRNYLLIIEEINRAEVAAVFGDAFQLLDRNADGRSVYDINIPEDLMRYLQDHHEVQGNHEVYPYQDLLQGPLRDGKLFIPANMYLWATMNSADQGVMPLDTAFKRRWTFKYISVDIKKDDDERRREADFGPFKLADGSYTWLEIRDRINDRLKAIGGITEDRLLGPFFMQKENVPEGDAEAFIRLFESKVLMYLFQDIAQYADSEIFASHYVTYSDLCQAFREKGMAIFPVGSAQEG